MGLDGVRDHIPLEQGLRPNLNPIKGAVFLVRDHIPLEQGLRLKFHKLTL